MESQQPPIQRPRSTYRYVRRPVRNSIKDPQKVFIIGCILFVILSLISAAILMHEGTQHPANYHLYEKVVHHSKAPAPPRPNH